MEAPDKLFIAPQWRPKEKKDEYYVSVTKTTHPREEEYIRKASLMEWAVYMRDKNQFGTYEYSMFQHMIDKIDEI